MRKQDIKPGVVYAYVRGRNRYDKAAPIVFLNTPADGRLYSERDSYARKDGVKPAFLKAREGAKPHASRGVFAGAGDTGYPAAMIYEHGDGDEATPEDLLAVTLADFEAATQTIVKGIQYLVLASLTPIVGEWEQVTADYEARQQADRERITRENAARDASCERAGAAIAALARAGIKASRGHSHGTVEALHISPDEAEKLIALLDGEGESESQRFQIREAQEALGHWDAELGYPGRADIQRTLADHLRNLLALLGAEAQEGGGSDG